MQNIAISKLFKSRVVLALFILLSAFFYFAFNFYPQINGQSGVALAADSDVLNKSSMPERLIIPSINVNAPMQYVGLAPNNTIGVPEGPYDVAWFNLSPRPGEIGSAIITGHYGPWINGAESVFNNLYKLKDGDKIYVEDLSGKLISFMVEDSHIYNLNASVPDLFNKNDGAYLDLITCNGTWIQDKKTYDNRLVIFAKEI